MIELQNIEKSFGTHKVLDSVDLNIEAGHMCMLLGPSGCGKSTIIRLINQLLLPEKGQVLIDGKNSRDMDPQQLRRNMGYAIQGVGLFPHMHVRENIAVVPRLLKWNKAQISNRVDELLDLVGLPEHFGNKYPHQLSGGEAQRVGVARALAADPDILLMDEPFGALDPVNRLRLQQEFLRIQKQLKKTVVFVTHDVGEAVRMGDSIVILQNGQILAKGDPVSIVHAAEDVANTFLGNSYTLELLGKYTIDGFKSVLTQVESDTYDIQVMPGTSTLHEVLSNMFLSGRTEVIVQIEGMRYKVSFDLLVTLLRGEVL